MSRRNQLLWSITRLSCHSPYRANYDGCKPSSFSSTPCHNFTTVIVTSINSWDGRIKTTGKQGWDNNVTMIRDSSRKDYSKLLRACLSEATPPLRPPSQWGCAPAPSFWWRRTRCSPLYSAIPSDSVLARATRRVISFGSYPHDFTHHGSRRRTASSPRTG